MEDIIHALEKLNGKGSFCSKKVSGLADLKIEIDSIGKLKFPLVKKTIKSLIDIAKPAKFGWRDKTLLNRRIRDVWEISANQLTITGDEWKKNFASILEQVKDDLGLQQHATLKPSLHNLLIYERGQFFSPHQDSEKLKGMIASLVVILPSEHSGGSLVLDHQGVKKIFETKPENLEQLTYIAFYADCHHEVKPVSDGYRIALTYNLVFQESKNKKSDNTIKEPSIQPLIASITDYFSSKNDDSIPSWRKNEPKKLVYLLDHEYTQKSLNWKQLKNDDRLRAEALKKVANKLNLEIYMALADIQETWDAENSYDDDEEPDPTETELITSDTVLKHWVDTENKATPDTSMNIDNHQLCWTKATYQFQPFDSEYEGWMGNYGNTIDRWYHRAAIILWQKSDHYPMLLEANPEKLFKELVAHAKKKDGEIQLQKIIKTLLPYWASHVSRKKEDPALIVTILNLALAIQDPKLAFAMLKDFDLRILTLKNAPLFLVLSARYTTQWGLALLTEWAKPERYDKIVHCEKLSSIVRVFMKSEAVDFVTWLLNNQWLYIQRKNDSIHEKTTRVDLMKGHKNRADKVIEFNQACIISDQHDLYLKGLEYVIKNPKLYPAFELSKIFTDLKDRLDPKKLKKWNYSELSNHVIKQLKQEQKTLQRDADDWSITEKLPCDCVDCSTLSIFLNAKVHKQQVWPLAESRRKHITDILAGLGVEVTHETERKGSPYRLILTKTPELHQHAKTQQIKIEKILEGLRNL